MELVDVRTVELEYTDSDHSAARREPWTAEGPVASPMTRYPRYGDYRPSWLPEFEGFGCVVEAADGTTGVAAGVNGRPVAALIEDYLGPRIVGERAAATEKLYDMLVRLCAPFGATGLAAYAVSAVDLALWDLRGKLDGRPVYELLGGPARESVTCYATGNDTDWHLELGFDATKLACPYGPADGREGLRKNEELVAAARETVGEDVEIMLDCWMAFDVDYTVRLADCLREYDLRWIEEPLPPENVDAHARLRERLPGQPLATGEHWFTPAPFAHAVAEGLVDVLQPDVQWVGGLTALRRIVSLAAAAGVTVIPHGGGNTPYGQHACYALPDIPWGEYFVGSPPGVPLAETSRLPGTAVPEDGRVVPPDRPGFGVDVDPRDLDPFLSG